MNARHRFGDDGVEPGTRVRVTSRRRALGLGAAAIGGVVLGGSWPAQGRADRSTGRVLVIGAGLAGLSCALELVEKGYEVTIIEARLRPGGRVRTLREFADGLHVEAGAARIPGDHDLTLGYARRFGLEVGPFYPPGVERLPLAKTSLMRIVDGNDRLPAALAARLSAHLRYGCAVTRIEHDSSMVRVLFDRAGRSESAVAEHLVCTIPFSVLRTLDIDPQLSASKRHAIATLGYQSLTRASIQVRERFWRAGGSTGYGMTDAGTEIWHPTWDQPGERAVVQAYMKHDLSRRVTGEGAAARQAIAMGEVERVLPGIAEHAEGCVCVCWEEEPWARGASVVLRPGEDRSLMPHVGTPEGRIHFAGEHASRWHGWMQGALASGVRAAHEIAPSPK